MRIAFERSAFEDFVYWSRRDKRIRKRIIALITDALRSPTKASASPSR